MEELKSALLGYFGSRIRRDGLTPDAAANTDPAQVAFINDAVATVARHVVVIRGFCNAADMGRVPGFVGRSFALACRDLLTAYETAVLQLDENDACSIVELQTTFGGAMARCGELIRLSKYPFADSSYEGDDSSDYDDDDYGGFDNMKRTSPSAAAAGGRAAVVGMPVNERWRAISGILSEPLLPSPIRVAMGQRVYRSLLVNIGQWMCYGVILDQQRGGGALALPGAAAASGNAAAGDFFVVTTADPQHRPTAGELAVDELRVPFGFPLSLCSTILLAGRDRRQLDAEKKGRFAAAPVAASTAASSAHQHQQSSFLMRAVHAAAPAATGSGSKERARSSSSSRRDRAGNGDDVGLPGTHGNDISSGAHDAEGNNNNNSSALLAGVSPDGRSVADGAAAVSNNSRSQQQQQQQRRLVEETPTGAYRLLCSEPGIITTAGRGCGGAGGGSIALDELERRANRIRAAWARQLWTLVAQRSALRDELLTVRDMFLCNRGDLWHTFVERSSPAILGWTFSGGPGGSASSGGDAALEIAQQQRYGATADAAATAATKRWTLEAFRNAMADVRLSESERHTRFEFVFNEQLQQQRQSVSQARSLSRDQQQGQQQQQLSFDDAGRSIFATIRLLGIKWRLPSALTHVIKPNAIAMYEKLFVSNLVLKFSVFCLNQCKRFSSEAETLSSNAGRHYAHCVSLLHFFLSNVAYSWQVDVQDTHFTALFEQLERAESVDEALRAHTLFVDNLAAGAFLADEGRDVARCIGELVMLAFGLFALAREDSTRKTLDAIAVAEKRGEQMSARGAELTRTMQRIVGNVVRRVTTVISPLSSSRRAEHRALWTRLDFNGWFTQQLQKANSGNAVGVAAN